MSVASALTRRRAEEKYIIEREAFLKDNLNTDCIVKWEHRTSGRIEKQDAVNRAKILIEEDAYSLQLRRLKIRELYQKEMEGWIIAIEASQHVSTDERIQYIRQKAYKLKEKRKKERQEFVRLCYERQWRDSCDDIRALDARATTDKLIHDRNNAFTCKETREKKLYEDEKKSEEIKQRTRALEEREINDGKLRQQKNLEMKLALDEQVKSLRLKNEKMREQRRREENEQLEQWRSEDAKKRKEEVHSIREAHERGEEVLHANLERLEVREREKVIQREQDIVLLDYALNKEQQEILNEAEQKHQDQEAVQEYVRFLKEQMTKDQEDTNRIDSIRDAEMEKVWERRDGAQKVHVDARRQLSISEVKLARIEQIQEKEHKLKEDKNVLAREVAENIFEWEQQEQMEKDKASKQKAQTVQNMMANKVTVEKLLREKARQKQEKFLLHKQIQYAEKQHCERVENEAGSVAMPSRQAVKNRCARGEILRAPKNQGSIYSNVAC